MPRLIGERTMISKLLVPLPAAFIKRFFDFELLFLSLIKLLH